MLTEAVGIVDRAANDETFLVVKRANMGKAAQQADKTKTAKDAVGDADATAATTDGGAADGSTASAAPAGGAEMAKAPLKLPAAAKESMLSGLSGALEKLSAVADMVNTAEVGDAAAVPPEIGQALGDVAAILTGLAGSGDAGGDMKAAGDAAGVEKAELDDYTAMHVTLEAVRCRLWGAMDLIKSDPAKAVAELQAAATMLQSASTMVTAKSAKSIAKAGRKMSKGRLSLFKQAFDIMATLLKELEDEGEEAAVAAATAAGAAASAAAGAADAAAPQAPGALAKALDAIGSFEPGKLLSSIGEVLTVAKSLQTSVASLGAKVQAHDIALAKAAKSVAPSNAAAVEGESSQANKQHVWPMDIAAAVREEESRAKGK